MELISLRPGSERRLHSFLQLLRHGIVVADEPFHKLTLAIEHERLRYAIVVREKKITQRLVREAEWILNVEFTGKGRNFHTVICAPNVEADDL